MCLRTAEVGAEGPQGLGGLAAEPACVVGGEPAVMPETPLARDSGCRGQFRVGGNELLMGACHPHLTQIGHWRCAHIALKAVIESAHTQAHRGSDVGHRLDIPGLTLDKLQRIADRLRARYSPGPGEFLGVVMCLTDKKTRHDQPTQLPGHRGTAASPAGSVSSLCNSCSARENGDAANRLNPRSKRNGLVAGAPNIPASSASTEDCSKSTVSMRQSSVRYSTTTGSPGETTTADPSATRALPQLLRIRICPPTGRHTATSG